MNKRHASYLLFIVLSFVPNVTNSEMYKWKGKDGTMNFTDDLSTVPDVRYAEKSGHESLVNYKLEVSEWKESQTGSTQRSFG